MDVRAAEAEVWTRPSRGHYRVNWEFCTSTSASNSKKASANYKGHREQLQNHFSTVVFGSSRYVVSHRLITLNEKIKINKERDTSLFLIKCEHNTICINFTHTIVSIFTIFLTFSSYSSITS